MPSGIRQVRAQRAHDPVFLSRTEHQVHGQEDPSGQLQEPLPQPVKRRHNINSSNHGGEEHNGDDGDVDHGGRVRDDDERRRRSDDFAHLIKANIHVILNFEHLHV